MHVSSGQDISASPEGCSVSHSARVAPSVSLRGGARAMSMAKPAKDDKKKQKKNCATLS